MSNPPNGWMTAHVKLTARRVLSPRRWSLATTVTAIVFLVVSRSAVAAAPRTPVVIFPGYGTTVLQVTVHDQTSVESCPSSGTYEDGIPANVGTTFSQVCRDKLITPRWKPDARLPFPKRFSLPPGVKVTIPHYGQTVSAPVYNAFYALLEAAGYNLVVAGYDLRLTPDLGGFLSRTKRLIVRTWRRNHKRAVRLVGHSNGPLYAEYLLTHVSPQWKHKYIQGFTDIAGNLPGQGALWTWVFTGVEVPSVFSLPTTVVTARSSARLMALSLATWMSASDPAVFGRREVVIKDTATGRSYTPADTVSLLHDAGLDSLKAMVEHYLGFVRFAEPRYFPNVDVSAEKGSGLQR
jgi:lecithin-cholesterol acyltransferase